MGRTAEAEAYLPTEYGAVDSRGNVRIGDHLVRMYLTSADGSGVNEVTCPAGGITGKYLAIYLPRKRTSLMLCGVQVHSQT